MRQQQYQPMDIRRLDLHQSSDLANLVTGNFYLGGMSHEMKVVRLAQLQYIYEAVIKLGMLEHSADWDWRVEVLVEGELGSSSPTAQTMVPAEPKDKEDNNYYWTDCFELDMLPGATDCTHLKLYLFPNNEGVDSEVLIEIDRIRIIYIGQA